MLLFFLVSSTCSLRGVSLSSSLTSAGTQFTRTLALSSRIVSSKENTRALSIGFTPACSLRVRSTVSYCLKYHTHTPWLKSSLLQLSVYLSCPPLSFLTFEITRATCLLLGSLRTAACLLSTKRNAIPNVWLLATGYFSSYTNSS